MIREIGVRDLKPSLSEVIRAVERGAHVRVTLRGRAVPDIVPAGTALGDERVRACRVHRAPRGLLSFQRRLECDEAGGVDEV